MRIPSSVFRLSRYLAVLAVVAGSIAVFGAANKTHFSRHDKAYFADPSVIEYVQPGLVFSVVSANIAKDGTISVDFKITDPTGAALDRAGVLSPGAVATSFLIADIPKGQSQFTSYITRTVAAATGSATAIQAAADSGGTYQTVATGEYIYTFGAKAPAAFDPTASHRVGIYGSRNLTVWDLGTNYASTTFDWVPAGNGAKPAPRDVVRTPDCNKCHDQLSFHGGSRRGVELCIMCHTPQTTDPDTGNTVDMPVMIHKIHMGSQLPSVIAGKPYQIIGFQNAVTDWSTVVYPADPRNCVTCHNPNNGAAQTTAWWASPNRAACGACHDSDNFATGQNHAGGPQFDDNQCSTCHIKQGELPFDASILGAHVLPTKAQGVPGINFALTKVTSGAAGQKPTVTFTLKDNQGNAIPLATVAANAGSISLTMAGPTSDYGYTSFGSDVTTTPGYVTESVTATNAQCGSDGTCTYTFTHPVPAGSKGTYAIGIEGRMTVVLLPGTTAQTSVTYSGLNQVIYFSADGTPVTPRRTVVALANCNNCHSDLELHGGLRNNTEYCVICHNPSNTDFTTRPTSVVAADKALPNQAINLALMVHKIHTGENLAQFNQTYIIVGFRGSHNDFSDVRFPAMSPTGAVHDTTNCAMCHVNSSEGNFPIGKNQVMDPQGLLNPAPATTSACTACHLNTSAFAHAVSEADPKFGESCDVCHGTGAPFDVDVVHAGK